jgi:hypothetical protein
MNDPITNVEIEDVLSSIRRLVSEDLRGLGTRPAAPAAEPPPPSADSAGAAKFVLTPALRIHPAPVDGDDALTAEPEDSGAAEVLSFTSIRSPRVEIRADASVIWADDGAHPAEADAPEAPGTDASLEDAIAELEAEVGTLPGDYEPDTGTASASAPDFADLGIVAPPPAPDMTDSPVPEADMAPGPAPAFTSAAEAWRPDDDFALDEAVTGGAISVANSGLPPPVAEEPAPEPEDAEADLSPEELSVAGLAQDADEDEAERLPPGDTLIFAHAARLGANVASGGVLSPGIAMVDDDLPPAPPAPEHAAPDDHDAEPAFHRAPRIFRSAPAIGAEPAPLPGTFGPTDDAHHAGLPVAAARSGSVLAQLDALDPAVLRPLVAELIREELRGALGQKITSSVRKLIRREVLRTLETRTLE